MRSMQHFKRASHTKLRGAAANFSIHTRPPGIGTVAVWGGEGSKERKVYGVQGATQVPIVNSVGYSYDNLDDWYDVALGRKSGEWFAQRTHFAHPH